MVVIWGYFFLFWGRVEFIGVSGFDSIDGNVCEFFLDDCDLFIFFSNVVVNNSFLRFDLLFFFGVGVVGGVMIIGIIWGVGWGWIWFWGGCIGWGIMVIIGFGCGWSWGMFLGGGDIRIGWWYVFVRGFGGFVRLICRFMLCVFGWSGVGVGVEGVGCGIGEGVGLFFLFGVLFLLL